MQSAPETIAEQLKPGDLPFDIICDPKGALYNRYAIRPASSMLTMSDAASKAKVATAVAAGFRHGKYEGNEFQLPAAFVLDADRRVSYAHYGTTVGDVPTADALAAQMR